MQQRLAQQERVDGERERQRDDGEREAAQAQRRDADQHRRQHRGGHAAGGHADPEVAGGSVTCTDTAPPMPAKANCPSESWPAMPVTTLTDRPTMAKPTVAASSEA